MIRAVSLFIFIFYFSLLGNRETPKRIDSKKSTIFFSSDSFLKIKGKTNVSSFECVFNMDVISDSITVSYDDFDNFLRFDKAKLVLPNGQFNCGGRAINKDFNKLLNTEAFPEITIKLIEILRAKTANHVKATVAIEICDIVNLYTIPISVNQNDVLSIEGTLPFDILDFKLEAPTKALGIVKVSPLIEIVFSLKIINS